MKGTNTFGRQPNLHFHLPIEGRKTLHNLGNILQKKWESFLISLEMKNEPRVWTTHDRHGDLSWHVYDPQTNQSWMFASEDEVRIYLEERYSF